MVKDIIFYWQDHYWKYNKIQIIYQIPKSDKDIQKDLQKNEINKIHFYLIKKSLLL